MAYIFGDSFDCYAAGGDAVGFWDTVTTPPTIVSGRFSGSRAIQNNGSGVLYIKSSSANDAIHHIVCAYQQTTALSGASNCCYFMLGDGATVQCSVVFRQDGAILLQSGAVGGTTLATYTGAVSLQSQWFAFEIEVVVNSATGSITVRKNGNTGTPDFTLGSLNTRGGTTNNYANRLTIGQGSGIPTWQLDDLLWRSDASSVAWVGDIRCYTRMPVSDSAVQFARSTMPNAAVVTPTNINTSYGANATHYVPYTPTTYSGLCTGGTLNFNTASSGGTGHVKLAIFSNNAGAPGTLLGTSSEILNPPASSIQPFTISSPPYLQKGIQYWIGLNQDATIGYNVVGTSGSWTGSTTYASWPASNPTVTTLGSVNIPGLILTFGAQYNVDLTSEAQQDGATTYVYDSTVNDADFYGIASIGVTPATVIAVTTRGFLQKSDAGSRSGAVQLKSGGTTVNSGGAALSTTFAWMWRTDTTDPATGSAWTTTGVNNAQIGPTVTA